MPPTLQPLLLPVDLKFIVVSLVAALALHMLPLGRVVWTPDWVMLLLAFWGTHEPRRVGLGVAFFLGLCVDVYQSALLGQHALVYCALMLVIQLTHRRLQWFGARSQALQLAPLFAAAHTLQLLLGWINGGVLPGWELLLAPLLETLLWPLVSWLMLLPQRRPPRQEDEPPL